MARKKAIDDPLLQESFPDAHDILMDAPIGIFTSTPEGRYISVNPALASLIRW